MTTATETAVTTQVHSIYIKATPQAIWDAITKPEWSERYNYASRVDYDLKPGGTSGKLEYADQIRRYVDFFHPGALPGVQGGVTPMVGTILYEVEVQHPDVMAPIDIPGTAGQIYIGLQLKGPGFIEYFLGARMPPFVPVPVEGTQRPPM